MESKEKKKVVGLEKDLAAFARMSVTELCRRHVEVFGEELRSRAVLVAADRLETAGGARRRFAGAG